MAGRAFYEADWEIKMPEIEKAKMRKDKEVQEVKKGKEMMKPKEKKEKKAAEEEEFERFFPAPATADVITYLYVPLAPTPTSRMPLQASGSPSRFLPLDTLAYMHTSHHTHSLRVSSLFMRLDQARVWERGVKCSAFGDPSGMCTVLKVEFTGWTESMVRGVIGESGTGWCEIEEVRKGEEDEMDSVLSEMSSVADEGLESENVNHSPFAPSALMHEHPQIDPSQSFVLPTLDFSSSFYAASRQSVAPPLTPISSGFSTPTSDIHSPLSPSFSDHELFSDFSDSGSEHSFSSGSFVDPPSVSARSVGSGSWYGGFGFSSGFADMAGENTEPREVMF